MIKRILVAVFICLYFISPVFAITAVHMKSTTDDSVTFLVGSANTLYTKTIDMNRAYPDDTVGVMYKATALQGGAIDLHLTVQQSYKPPATAGASDTAYLSTGVITTSVADELWHLATIDTLVLPYMRFFVQGQGSNAAGTTVEIKTITSGM